MRIGELAALVGVTPRAVRHYHQLGLLPEPARRSNGYREYALRDAVVLARIRRLSELGLGLDEVRNVLAGTEGRDLVEVLEELDDDLGRQEAVLGERRTRLAALLAQARAGHLAADGPLSPELTALLADLGERSNSPMAAKDREHLAYFDTVLPEETRGDLMAVLRGMGPHAAQVYAVLDALADLHPDDPQVRRSAAALAALLPDTLAAHLPSHLAAHQAAEVYFDDLSPAQAAAVRDALALLRARRA
ncbi:MerR family transcriptional regulator [Kribbella sp. NPDC026611]|uniref:MerR family transcriptional regulator n=1 Tax=Kribbella sp. NPDC026611 TaxID=3154911 RepID=UPI003411D0C5